MRHRKMLITAIVLIAVGFILWQILCPIAMLYGIGSYKTGWWIFSETHYYTTPLYWVGLALGIVGIILVVIGIVLIPIVAILEYTERTKVNRKEVES